MMAARVWIAPALDARECLLKKEEKAKGELEDLQ